MWLNHKLTLNNLTVWWWRQGCALIILIVVLNMLWEVLPLQGRKGKRKGKEPYWTAELARWYDGGGGLELNSQTIKKRDTLATGLVRLYIIGWWLTPASDNQELDFGKSDALSWFHGQASWSHQRTWLTCTHCCFLDAWGKPQALYFQSSNLKFSIHLEGKGS